MTRSPDYAAQEMAGAWSAKIPGKETLKKYGLTAWDWLVLLEQQGGVCAVCKRVPTTGRLCIDHEHVKGWKRMTPEKRKGFVRGLLCFFCNRYYVGRCITVERSRNVTEYLLRYETEKILQCLDEACRPSATE